MLIDNKKHTLFLEQELQAQIKDFESKLNTSASQLLLVDNLMYIAKFIKFRNDGELLLKLSSKHKLPRRNEYLYAITVPDQYRSYKTWGDMTYGNLIEKKTAFSEVHCVWQAPSEDDGFCLIGMRGVSAEFAEYLEKVPGCIVILGPQVPPFEYLANLQKVVSNSTYEINSDELDSNDNVSPILITDNAFDCMSNSVSNNDINILQGPPGTGKTYLIAQLCKYYCDKGMSVLVTALTNRALMEVASKPFLEELLKQERVYKTNITCDEVSEQPLLVPTNKLNPEKGSLKLSTFYLTSGVASEMCSPYQERYDIVIMDEASQAFLGMFLASLKLGKKILWVGDTKQMPPIVLMNEDRIIRHGFNIFVDGMSFMVNSRKYPVYQLTYTYRLSPLSTELTSLFYKGNLTSMSNGKNLSPILLTLPMKLADASPEDAINRAVEIIINLYRNNGEIHVAFLSHKIETVKAMQKKLNGFEPDKKNLTIETVARIQGLTVDYTIYLVPRNDCMVYSLEDRLFNVATSRAKSRTIIIGDDGLLNYCHKSQIVSSYLKGMKHYDITKGISNDLMRELLK